MNKIIDAVSSWFRSPVKPIAEVEVLYVRAMDALDEMYIQIRQNEARRNVRK